MNLKFVVDVLFEAFPARCSASFPAATHERSRGAAWWSKEQSVRSPAIQSLVSHAEIFVVILCEVYCVWTTSAQKSVELKNRIAFFFWGSRKWQGFYFLSRLSWLTNHPFRTRRKKMDTFYFVLCPFGLRFAPRCDWVLRPLRLERLKEALNVEVSQGSVGQISSSAVSLCFCQS